MADTSCPSTPYVAQPQAHATVQQTTEGTVSVDLHATEQSLAIEVEDDRDSAFGGSDDQSSASTSLASSVFDYVYEASLFLSRSATNNSPL